MRKFVIISTIVVLLILLALWSPWNNINFSWKKLLGIEKPDSYAGLVVNSLGGNMEIKIDGESRGEVNLANSPIELAEIDPGEHDIELVRKASVEGGYESFFKKINFEEGINSVLSYELGPTNDFSSGYVFYAQSRSNFGGEASLTVTSVPETSKVYLNDVVLGEAPMRDVKIALTGKHKLKVEADGYEPLEFEILPDEQTSRDKLKDYSLYVEVRLFKLPLNVVEEVSE